MMMISESLEFKSRKDVKELCKQFGIRTAGVKHEDLVHLLRTKLQKKKKTKKQKQKQKTELAEDEDLQLEELLRRSDNNGSNSCARTRLSFFFFDTTHGSDFVAEDGEQLETIIGCGESAAAFSSSTADMESLQGSLADLPSDCSCYFNDTIPAYPFEIDEEIFPSDHHPHDDDMIIMTSKSSGTKKCDHIRLQESDHQFHRDAARNSSSSSSGGGAAAGDDGHSFSLQTAFMGDHELLSLYTATAAAPPSEELSLFAIPDWVPSTSFVDDPPLLDREKKRLDESAVLPTNGPSRVPQRLDESVLPTKGPTRVSQGNQLVKKHNAAVMLSSAMAASTSAAAAAARALGGRDHPEPASDNLATSSSSSTRDDLTFADSGFHEEDYVTSDAPFSELALLPATDLVDSILLVEAQAEAHHHHHAEAHCHHHHHHHHHHLPAPGLGSVENEDHHGLTLLLVTELWELGHTEHRMSQRPVLLGILDATTWQDEAARTEFAKGSAADDDAAPADAFLQPIDNSLEAKFVGKSHEDEEEAEEEALVPRDSAANSLPMSVSEHAVGDATKGHNTAAEIRRESLAKLVGFPLSVILWCARFCSSS